MKKAVKKSASKKTQDTVAINCAYDELVKISDLKPNPKNPNTHPKRQIELLAKIMKTQGWRAPITVSTRSGFIVRGHGRLAAAMMLKLTEVPVDHQDYKTDDEERADLLADNQIAELADMNQNLLVDMLRDFAPTFDIELTGFFTDDVHKMLDAASDREQDAEQDDIPDVFGVVVECSNDKEQRRLIDRLTKEGLKCRALM